MSFPRAPSRDLIPDTAAYVMYAAKFPDEHEKYIQEIWEACERYESIVRTYGTVEEIEALKRDQEKALERTEAACRKREDDLAEREKAFDARMAEEFRRLEVEQAQFTKHKNETLNNLAERKQSMSKSEAVLDQREREAKALEGKNEKALDLLRRKEEAAKAFLEIA